MSNNNINGSKVLQKIDLAKCRLCQKNDGSIHFLTNSILCDRILFFTKINIIINSEEIEQLPKEICRECNQILESFIQFQENCLEINEQLKQLLEEGCKTKSISVSAPQTPEHLQNSTVLNNKDTILNRICNKCKEPKKSIRHCCQVEKIENIQSENILVKIESDEAVSTALDNGISYIFVISDESNQIKDDTQIEILDELQSSEKKIVNDDDFNYEILEEIPYQSENTSSAHHSDSEDDFKTVAVARRGRTNDSNAIRNYVCSVSDCAKIYTTKGGLKKHKYAEHNIRDFLCTTCGKHFGEHSGLKVHERIHANTKPYECNKCNQSFVQAANLRTHIKLHHEGHRYYCTKCGKGFLTSCTLKRHELVHIGKKDFQCDVDLCSSQFYTRRELIKHKKYHYDIRSHFCNICYKSFVEKHHLTIHMRSHTGERPYKCDINQCNKTFMDSQKLRRHKKNVHRCNLI